VIGRRAGNALVVGLLAASLRAATASGADLRRHQLSPVPRALSSCLLMPAACLRALLICLAGVIQLVAEVCKFVAKIGRVVMKAGRSLAGFRGTFSRSLRFTRRVLSLSLGFVAEPFEKPDALDQLLARCRIHD
jgi:hypothetical protein